MHASKLMPATFWQLKRLATPSTYRRYTNNCIYLSIYLVTPLLAAVLFQLP